MIRRPISRSSMYPDLPAAPLKFAEYTVGSGVDALVLGYPGAASFQASPAQIREVTEINGPTSTAQRR